MSIRILQSALLVAALIVGVFNPTFNGLSLLALALIGLAAYIPHRLASRPVWQDDAAAESC